MRRSVPVVLALFAAALALPAAASPPTSSPACGRGLMKAAEAADGSPVCSHGPDAPLDSGLGLPTDPSVPPAPCVGDGVTGARIHVLYGVPSDRTNNYASSLDTIRSAVATADYYFDTTGSATTQHLRWLCTGTGDVEVGSVTLPPVGDDGVFTFSDMYSVVAAAPKGKRNPGSPYRDANQVYIVFVDGLGSAYPYCGQGGVDADTTPGATNRNNVGPAYSLIACWDGTTTLHEIGHNLGAVQLTAPHSSGAYHCYDESDVMCYDDGGSYFLGPDGKDATADDGQLVASCPAPSVLLGTQPSDRQFDCNEDDYYNPAPASGSYLATHWNVASSNWVAR